MEYTLDSVTHFQAVLEERFSGLKVHRKEVSFKNLKDINLSSGTYYFGVISVGSNVIKGILKNEDDDEILTLEKNNQIVDFFSNLTLLDADENELAAPMGHFRGFELQVKGL